MSTELIKNFSPNRIKVDVTEKYKSGKKKGKLYTKTYYISYLKGHYVVDDNEHYSSWGDSWKCQTEWDPKYGECPKDFNDPIFNLNDLENILMEMHSKIQELETRLDNARF